MTARAERRAAGRWIDRIGLVGIALSLAFAALTWLQPTWADRLQSAWFDAYQSLAPRQVSVLPVTVVEIDQKSLAAIGQWPWPRTQLARLVNTLKRADAAAIALNVLMPEADALSPERLLSDATVQDRSVVAALRSLLSYDAVLAGALASAPTVLAFVGTADASWTPLRAAPITVQAKRTGGDAHNGGNHGIYFARPYRLYPCSVAPSQLRPFGSLYCVVGGYVEVSSAWG